MQQQTNYLYKKNTLRMAVGCMFFLSGICFASWASRIATIQQSLHLTDAALGAVLFASPVGLMLSLPFAGWVISKAGSRNLLMIALVLYGFALVGLGSANQVWQLAACLLCFGFASNSVNIAANTQAVATETFYPKPIMASFHGLWSLAGFTGAGIGTFMIGRRIIPQHHFILILAVIIAGVAFFGRYLNNDKRVDTSGPVFIMPDRSLIKLGIIAFCSLVCEGAMYDWSAVYFKKVIMAEGAWIGAGYTAFMLTMASGRFFADWFSYKFGLKRTLQISGSLTALGLITAVIFPYLLPSIGGFLLVGFGVSSVVPLVYSAAGKSKTMSPGMALSAVSTIGYIGFLAGPPVIGFIAGMTGSLRYSFMLVAAMGIGIVVVSAKVKL
jgi:MFS family permease